MRMSTLRYQWLECRLDGCDVFFLQAEDGIRDAQESRGLGDVYKRQLKDALLSAQKQGHLVIADAQEKADQIMAEAQEKAAALEDEAVRQHAIKMEQNRAEIAKEKEALIEAQRQVADFKKSLFDMYKSHLELISSMPETVDEETIVSD